MGVTRINRGLKPAVATATLAFLLLGMVPLSPAAEDLNWTPRPLVDTSKPANAADEPVSMLSQPEETPAGPSQAELEKALKPAEPFIKDVEAKLYLKPKIGASLVQRLNTIQKVLYGGQQYADAGELLAKLAEVFPQEAAKAQADLMRQVPTLPPQPATAASQGVIESKPTVNGQVPVMTAPPAPTSAYTQPAPTVQQSPKKKRSFWKSDDDDWGSFENDPFFNDNRSEPTYSSSSSSSGGGAGLRSLGQGLAGLAMMAGSVYMNGKINGSTPYRRYTYGDQPYAYPYGNGGYPYYAPYGSTYQSLPPGVAYPMPPVYSYTQPVPYTVQPYSAFGRPRGATIRPFGSTYY